jgi:hypothetical protein
MTAYYPRELMTPELKAKLLQMAMGYGAGALAFLVLLVVSSWKALGRLQRNRARR